MTILQLCEREKSSVPTDKKEVPPSCSGISGSACHTTRILDPMFLSANRREVFAPVCTCV